MKQMLTKSWNLRVFAQVSFFAGACSVSACLKGDYPVEEQLPLPCMGENPPSMNGLNR